MSTPEELNKLVTDVSDEELIERIRSGNYTDIANRIMREELAIRGIKYECTHENQENKNLPLSKNPKPAQKAFFQSISRSLAFPWNAFLGQEAPWKVLLIGVVIVFAASTLMVFSLTELHLLSYSRPVPSYTLAVAYTVAALHALIAMWFAISLWRTASHTQSTALEIALRLLAFFVAFYAAGGTMGPIRMFHDHFPDTRPSIMDHHRDP